MFKIDTLAYTSPLKKIPALEKLLFAVVSILIAIATKNSTVSLGIIMVNIFLTLYQAKIPAKTYLKLLFVPVSFLLAGIIPIILDFQGGSIVLDANGFQLALALIFSSFAALTAMYFLALTTPFFELAGAFKVLHLPKIFIELVLLIYRFIFILTETAAQMTTAQSARLGYVNLKSSYRSTALLFVNIFTSAFRRANEVFTAMLARNYTGEIRILHNQQKYSPLRIASIGLYFFVLITMAVFGGK